MPEGGKNRRRYASERLSDRESSSPARRALLATAKALISAALIYWLLRDTSLAEVATALRSARPGLLVAALAIYTLRYAVGAIRWRVMLGPAGTRASLPFLFRSNLVAVFFSNFLPSIIGGEAVRIYDTWRLGTTKGTAVAVIALDRFIGLAALVLFVLAGLGLSGGLVSAIAIAHLNWWLGLGSAAMLGVLWAVFKPPTSPRARALFRLPLLNRIADRLREPAGIYRGRSGALLKALALSVLIQGIVILHYVVLGAALGLPVPPGAYFLIVPVAVFLMMLPISINGIGIRENAFVFFFGFYGVSRADAVAFAWLAYGVVVLLGLAGGTILGFRREQRMRSDGGSRGGD
ncbi:MAG: lysylphosphatidylglycerol synthase transmembrane domain-containing protein [Gemmatimonadota bacterium]